MKQVMMLSAIGFIHAAAALAETQWQAPDFFVAPAPPSIRNNLQAAEFPTDCRAAIRRAVCLANPPSDNNFGGDRPCLEGSAAYAEPFERAYDQLPPHFQRMFCFLPKIYIEKDFVGSAYAGVLTEKNEENGRIVAGVLGVRQQLLDQPYSLAQWASWKEQIHFGVDAGHVNQRLDLPVVHTGETPGQSYMLYFLLAHEFGHIFDFTQRLSGGGWGELSWQDHDVPKEGFDFPLRKDLCFYFCEGKFVPAWRQDELYQSMGRTPFLSAYATRYSTEDFADSLAFYSLMTDGGVVYQISTPSGLFYDVIERLRADPLVLPKRRYLEGFLRSGLRYPGEGT